MNLKQNKGYVGIDISIGVIILLILVPTIMGIVYGVNSTNKAVSVKTRALNILVNAVETAKGTSFDEFNKTKLFENYQTNTGDTVTIDNTNNIAIISTPDVSFKLDYAIKDYHETSNEAEEDIVKTVTAIVTYKIGNKEHTMDLSTVLKWLEELWKQIRGWH